MTTLTFLNRRILPVVYAGLALLRLAIGVILPATSTLLNSLSSFSQKDAAVRESLTGSTIRLRQTHMIRLGIVDFDSSHAVEFTKRFNHVGVDSDQFVEGARVVIGSPGESEMSPERIAPHTEQLRSLDVDIVANPLEMIGKIDAVLILSLCGDVHLAQVKPFLEVGLPAYVDKPLACSVEHAQEMIQLASTHKVSLFSASALRYAEEIQHFQANCDSYGQTWGAVSFGPAKRMAGNPGLFHYGIHPTELLLTVMGPGCLEVTNTCAETADVVTGRWQDGRVGTLRGIRQGTANYGAIAFCERAVVPIDISSRYAYRNLCHEIVQMLQSGEPAISSAAMLETVAFIEAARLSELDDGRAVALNC